MLYWTAKRFVSPSTQVQDGCKPLQRFVSCSKYGDAATGKGFVDAASMADCCIETVGERYSRSVRDLILHRGHGADTPADEGGGGAGEEVGRTGLGTRA